MTQGPPHARDPAFAGDPRSEVDSLRGEVERLRTLALRERDLLDAVLLHSPHGIVVCDRQARLTLQNRAAERIWAGTSAPDTKGCESYRAYHANGQPFAAEDWPVARCLASGMAVEAEEIRFQRFDDSFGVLLASCAPIYDALGELTGAISLFADITRLKELEGAEAKRAASMARLQAIVSELAGALTSKRIAELSIDHCVAALGAKTGALWTVDASGTEARLERHLGFPDVAGERFDRVVLAGTTPLAQAVRRGEPLLLESESVACLPLVMAGRKLGALAFGFDAPMRIDDDDRSFLRLVAEHCAQALHRSRLYEAEQRARTEMALLYRLVDAVSRAQTVEDVYEPALDVVQRALSVERCSILLYDAERVMRFRAWRGLSAEYRRAAEGHSPWSSDTTHAAPVVIEDVELTPELAAYHAVFRAEGIRALGFFPLLHAGELLGKLMVYSSEPRRFGEPELLLSQTIAWQVAQAVARKLADAENKRLYEDAQAARAAAEAASRMKDDFLAIVSHELRTPLTAIAGWATILKGSSDAPKVAKGIEVIERNARTQSRIIDDILDVSRIIAGKLALDPRPTNASAVVCEAADALRTLAHSKDITLEVHTPDERTTVMADPERLRQVVSNLLSNAVKFTPPGGRVDVCCSRTADVVRISVVDSGPGIQPAFLPHVFERFRQADSSTTRSYGGLGLGLAIVRHLVELHGGSVAAESPGAGAGATFTVTLPVSATDDCEKEEQAALSEASLTLAGLRLVLVDDQADAREVLSEALVALGAHVRAVGSAREALEMAASFEPHVLISDIGMPEEDGYSLIRKLRLLPPPLGNLPAIALTAYTRTEHARMAREAGFHEYLAKPADTLGLAQAIVRTHRAANLGQDGSQAGGALAGVK